MPLHYHHTDPDNLVIPFRVDRADASGRLVRLSNSIDEILQRHGYPDPVSELLGKALLLVAMFGSTLKERQGHDGDDANSSGRMSGTERFILQTQSDGPVSMLVADYQHAGRLRGYARFDAEALERPDAHELDESELLGQGHLAMTIDRGGDMDRYQGIVALDGHSLAEAADLYFKQSEQLPTMIKLMMARHFDARSTAEGEGNSWRWRGGGLMIQKLTPEGGFSDDNVSGDALIDEDDGWNRASFLTESLKDHELLDPLLTPEAILYRLYHEDGVRVFCSSSIKADCGCSQERVERVIANFSIEEQRTMAEAEDDGSIHITCEFCNRSYSFEPAT